MLPGLVVGVASGLLQFWMLVRFTKAVTGNGLNKKSILLGISQFLLPLAVLLGCVFLLRDSLLWAASGMAAVLIVCAVARFLKKR